MEEEKGGGGGTAKLKPTRSRNVKGSEVAGSTNTKSSEDSSTVEGSRAREPCEASMNTAPRQKTRAEERCPSLRPSRWRQVFRTVAKGQ